MKKHRTRTAQLPIINYQLPFYLLFTLLLTYPLIFNLSTTVPNDIGDPLLNTWILAWDSHALLTDPLNLFNANIFHPLPNTLAYSEHLISTALLVLPLQLFFGEPIVAYNLSLLLTFPLAAWGMYLLTLRWTGRRDAAFIAGLIFAFNPYRFAAIAHLQLLTFHWLPFALLYLDKILTPFYPKHPSRSHYLAFTLFLTLQLLASWYLAIYTLLIVGIYLLIHLPRTASTHSVHAPHLSSILYPLSTSFLLSLLCTLPFALPYLPLLTDLRAARPLSLALSLTATLSDFLAAAPANFIFGPLTAPLRTRPAFTEENTLFLGLIAPLLVLITLLNFKTLRPTPYALRITLLSILLLSLLLTFPLPYRLLATLLPPSTIIRVPPRWIIPALFALASLAALGYTRLVPKPPRSMRHAHTLPHAMSPAKRPISQSLISNLQSLFTNYQLPITLLLLLETVSLPLPLAPGENRYSLNPAYQWLAAQPGPIALLELPLHSAPAPEFPEVKRLYASTTGWWRLVNGYSGYTPPHQTKLAQVLADFPAESALTALQNLAATSPQPLFLLIHPGEAPLDRTRWETETRWQTERNPTLRPIADFVGDYLYQIVPALDSTVPPLATFGPDQTLQLLHFDLDLTPLPPPPPRIILYWRSQTPQPTAATVFIHLRAADGFAHAQADGPPVNNHYPLTAWPSGQIIQDIHPLPLIDDSQVDHVAIGWYDPNTGQRFPAFGPTGDALVDGALLVPFSKQ
jgi:hypothetical protein